MDERVNAWCISDLGKHQRRWAGAQKPQLPSPAATLKIQETLGLQGAAEGKGDEVQPVSNEHVLGLLPTSPEPQMGAQHTWKMQAGMDEVACSAWWPSTPWAGSGGQLCTPGREGTMDLAFYSLLCHFFLAGAGLRFCLCQGSRDYPELIPHACKPSFPKMIPSSD